MTPEPTDPIGRTAEQRQDERDRVLGRAFRRAWNAGNRLGRSAKCAGWGRFDQASHAGDEDGCRNDGSSCLCECHDPKAETP